MPNILHRLVAKTLSSYYEKHNGSIFYPVGSSASFDWGSNTQQQNLKDFLEVPEVSTVINYRAWAQSMAELQIVSKTTNKPVSNNESIVKVLRRPNYFQSQKEFWRQTELFRSIFGNEYMYFLKPVGRPVAAMYTLPPQCVEVKYPVNSVPFFQTLNIPGEVKYCYTWNGRVYTLDTENILHLNDNNVNQNYDNYLSGTSKLNSLQANIRNIRAAYEARNVILENRGAIGILSNASKDGTGSTIPMREGEKESLQKNLQQYGALKRQYQYILTNLTLKWTQITKDLDKLRVYEETEEDFKMICNEYGTPLELFKGGKDGIFGENKEKVLKQFYQDTVIPTVRERVQILNDYLETESKSWHIVASFDQLPIFQEDIKERTESLNTLTSALNTALQDGAITVEDYKKELQKFNIGGNG